MRCSLALALLTACLPSEDLAGDVDHSDDDVPDTQGERPSDAELLAEDTAAGELPPPRSAAGHFAWDATDAHAGRINPHRESHGADAIRRSACLDGIARRWARRMASGTCGDDLICHRPGAGPSSLVAQAGRCWPWSSLGENVAVGPDEAGLFEAFLASPSHHANIDKDWHDGGWGKYGVGVFRRGDGRLYITQVFATRR